MNNFLKYCARADVLYILGFLLLAVAVVLGLSLGSTNLALCDFDTARTILVYVRLPRTVACILCGAALGVAGAVIQGVLSNNLASPGVIGVNSGAGLAVTLCTAFGIYGGWLLSFFSFIGAFGTVLAVSVISKKYCTSKSAVILIGVALNSFLNAISDTVITFDTDVGVMSNNFKIGEFTSVTYGKLIPSAVAIAISLIILFTLTNELDVLSLGEDSARSLGLNTRAMRTVFLILAASLAGCAVSLAGLLSFVGLIVPHTVRFFTGNRSSRLLPLCAIYGAGFVAVCDTAARTVFSPYEIPVGIIMSFLGVPFFLFLIVKRRG